MRKLLLLVLFTGTLTAGPKSLFYLGRDAAGRESFLAHASKVDILVPTWYNADAAGAVTGGPNAEIMAAARAHHVAVMPIIVNPGFNVQNFHQLLMSATARARMIASLLEECRKNQYLGIQFDFEHIYDTDRDALSGLVREAAAALHQEKFQLSIATVPNAPGTPGQGAFSRWIFANWRAAYDLKAIGEAVDLVCLMTYDEHTRYTPPGPVAGHLWTVENLKYALKLVPREKLSLGIPVYGYRWYAGDPGKDEKPNPANATVGAADVAALRKTYQPEVQWDATDRASWFWFYRDQTREWVFFPDARTFRARWDLVVENRLQGFCSWVLGKEDPAIWEILPSHQ